jgi:hypothetical protein
MKIYKYGDKTVRAETNDEACQKLGITMKELKKNGKILKYKTKYVNKAYMNQLNKRVKEGEKDKNAYQKDVIRQLKVNGCALCGYNKCDRALTFHHVDSTTKKFEIRVGRIRFSGLQEEVAKCMLLCLNCHSECHELEEKVFDKERKK